AARVLGCQAFVGNAAKEDWEAERSEASGRVTRGMLRLNFTPESQLIDLYPGGSRGKKVDAYRQEREETGIDPGEQDVEISAADGRRRRFCD
ncbi:hypothetical protein JAAARDRAFT_140647, partial [Jaapia argillacea MUCL 33604]